MKTMSKIGEKIMNSIASAILNQMKEKNMGITVTIKPEEMEERHEASKSSKSRK